MSHWQQLSCGQCRLTHDGVSKDFEGHDSLARYCRKHGINATPA